MAERKSLMSEILNVWRSGGWVMIPLFSLALLLYTQAFQLVLYVRRARLNASNEGRWFDWIRNPSDADGCVRQIIEHTQGGDHTDEQIRSRFDEIRRAWISLIDRRTIFIGMLVAVAPLMGLLGTVLGMIQTFLGISTSGGAETTGVVAAGISEALVTTQTGLTIALPGLFMVMIIRRQKHGLEAHLARIESLTLSRFKFE